MTKGYVSDVPDDDTVMSNPDCTIVIDSSRLNREQAITFAELGNPTLASALNKSRTDKSFDHTEMGDITFHIPLEQMVMMLMSVGIVDASDMGEENAE